MQLKTLIGLFLLCLFLGCRTDRDRDQKKTGFREFSAETPSHPTVGGDSIYYRFPSGREMLNYLHSRDFVYLSGLANPAEEAVRYQSARSRTLNLGVYLADMSYMILFDKPRRGEAFLDAVVQLTNKLRIDLPDRQKMIERVSRNLHNTDSLVQISEDYQSQVIDYLLETGQEKTLAVISTGSYIEGLYLALHMTGDYEEHRETVQRIAEQKYAVGHLKRFCENYRSDAHARFALDYLKQLYAFYQQLPVHEEKTRVRRKGSNRMVFDGGDRISMPPDRFEEFKALVFGMRNEIVKAKQ